MTRDLTAVLPDGSDFDFWEQPLQIARTLHVDAHHDVPDGDGSPEKPFAAIQSAADIAQPGDRVLIHPGIYRECVRPKRGGTDAAHMISYEAEGEVIISACEIVTDFAPSMEYRIDPDTDGKIPQVWQIRFPDGFFRGYNPFGVVNCIHEKEWLRYARVDAQSSLTPYFLRRGMVYADGRALRQVQLYRLMQNRPGSYWVEEDGMTVHFRLPEDDDPAAHCIEVSCREQNFAPAVPFLPYIRLKGLTCFGAANGAPVPQKGAISCGRGHHWVIEDCVIRHANALGLDCGNEGWSLKTHPGQQIGYTVLRRNRIEDSGVCGIAGIGACGMLVEDNEITRTGWQHMEYGWEASALKFHNCVSSLFRRNIFRDSDQCDGLWLDCGNYNDRITQNLFLNICSPHAMIFMECNRGGRTPREILIDNNILWRSERYDTPERVRETITFDSTHWNDPFDLSTPIGEGIAGYGSDDMRIVHNFIGCIGGFGYSHNVIRGRMHEGRGGTARNTTVYGNVFYDCKQGAIRLPNHDHHIDGNCYAKVPEGFLVLTYPAPTEQLDLVAWQRFEGFDLHGGYASFSVTVDEDALTMTVRPQAPCLPWTAEEVSGYSAMPMIPTDEIACTDYFGQPTGKTRLPGAIQAHGDSWCISLDPRKR